MISSRRLPLIVAGMCLTTTPLPACAEDRDLTGAGYTFSLAFSPDGKTLVSGHQSGAPLKVWDVANGRQSGTLQKQRFSVYALAYSREGKALASGTLSSGDLNPPAVITIFDMPEGKARVTIQHDCIVIRAVHFSPDSRTVAVAASRATEEGLAKKGRPGPGSKAWVTLYDVASGKETKKFLQDATVYAAAYSPDGKTLAVGNGKNLVRLQDASTGEELFRVQETSEETVISGGKPVIRRGIYCLAFSPDGKVLATGAAGGLLKLWDAATGKQRAELKGHEKIVYSLAFTPDGKTLVTGSADRTVRLWDVGTLLSGGDKAKAAEPVVLKGHELGVYCVAVSPDGRTLASGSGASFGDPKGNGGIKLWDLAKRR